jgi:hypothetical protein
MLKLPPSATCPECRQIARALQAAWRHDADVLRARLVDAAYASGKEVLEFDLHWVLSLAGMPDEELKGLLDLHYPQVKAAMTQRTEHEQLTGHTVMWNVWWTPQGHGWREPE